MLKTLVESLLGRRYLHHLKTSAHRVLITKGKLPLQWSHQTGNTLTTRGNTKRGTTWHYSPLMWAVRGIQHQLCRICHNRRNLKLIRRQANRECRAFHQTTGLNFSVISLGLGKFKYGLHITHHWITIPLLGCKSDIMHFILRRCRLKYLVVRDHGTCNWHAINSEKICTYVSIYIGSEAKC